MNDKPLVSVITPFYNTAPKFMEEAIQSVFAQTYDNWELILVNDGSASPGTDLARSYAASDPGRIFYFEHPGRLNRGHSASRNLGIRNSKGKYIAFLDADDIWLPRKLEDQLAILETCPGAGMVYANTKYWHSWTRKPEDARRDYFPELGVESNVLHPPLVLLPLFLTGTAAVPSMNSLLIRSDAIMRSGLFDESFQSLYGDQHFYAKLCISEYIYVSNNWYDLYRQHPESMTSSVEKSRKEIQTRHYFLHWLEEYLTRKAVTDWKVWQSLRREIWRIHCPDWMSRSESLQGIVRRAKKWFLKAEEHMLPESIRNRIWLAPPRKPSCNHESGTSSLNR